MDTTAWKPGTTRWTYLLTGLCCACLAVGLPLAITVNTETGWVTFSIFMISAAGQAATAWLVRRRTRHTTTSDSGPAPHRQGHTAELS